MLLLACLAFALPEPFLGAQPAAGPTTETLIADFEDGSLDRWQSSMSGEYYRGGQGQQGLAIVRDAERGSNVLAAQVRWTDPQASERAFITRFLPEPLPRPSIVSVSFAYRLSSYDLDDDGGFLVRLRYSDTDFTDYRVSTGKPLPAGRWVNVTLNTGPGSDVRNIYGSLFGTVREITFRLDDADSRSAEFELRLDDLRLTMSSPTAASYTPQPLPRPTDGRLDVLYLKHSAEGFFPLEASARFAADAIGAPDRSPGNRLRLDTYLFRGLHFPFFGFPESRDGVLAHDLIVMLDVDPYVLTWPQATWIADAVASGAGLLFIAGPNTLSHAQDFKAPLAAIIPATFEPKAADQAGGSIRIAEPPHPTVAGLDAERLGRVGSMADVSPKAGAETPLLAGGHPLLVVGEAGEGRTALLTTWPQIAEPRDECFLAADDSQALLDQLLLWLVKAETPVAVGGTSPPPRRVTGEADLECGLELRSAERRPVRVQWTCGQASPTASSETVTVNGPTTVSHSFHVAPPKGPQEPVEIGATVLDDRGRPLVRRRFLTHVLSPLTIEGYAWHGRRAFAPGWPLQCGAELTIPGLPRLESSGAGATLSLAGSGLRLDLPTMADLWVHKPGTNEVYHSFSAGEVLSDALALEGLLPVVTTEALLRATRTDGNLFDADNRVAKARRLLRARPDGVVECVFEYEFVRDVRVERMPVLLTLPVAQWAGTPFRLRSDEGEREGVLPPDADPKRDGIADVHGLDLELQTAAGPVCIRWAEPGLRAWLRDLRIYGMDQYRLELESPYAGQQAKAGDTYATRFEIAFPAAAAQVPPLEGLTVSARLREGADFATSKPVWEIGSAPAAGAVEFTGILPNLESGRYWLEFAAVRLGAEPIASDALDCWIVDNLDRARFFPLISILGTSGGGHQLDEAGACARVDDLWRVGFNTTAYGGATRFAREHVTNLAAQIDAYAEGYAFSRGMASILEYTSYTRLSHEGAGDPSPFAPESMAATHAHVQPYLDVADADPRLLSVKVLDEPTASESALDAGPDTRRAFAERYGGELRSLQDLGDDPLARWRLSQFIGDYVAEEYRQGYQIKHEQDRSWDLLLTYMSPGLGYGRALSGQEDALKWSRYADRLDFDVYPYFYPASQKIRMVQANYCHAFQRGIAQHLNRPCGFYVELDDRNYPFQINPPEASAECAYTALGQGVGYLNSFINQAFGTGVQSRPERWEYLAQELPRIRRLGPMLQQLKRPPAPVALLYPMTQARIKGSYPVPHYTFALLSSAFGDVDVLHEEVLLEAGIPTSCRAVVLLRTKILARRTFDALVRFVEGGGVLLTDESLPETDETGAPLQFPFDPSSAKVIPTPKVGVDVRWQPLGRGTVIAFSADLEPLVKEAVEGNDAHSSEIADPAGLAAWHDLIRQVFAGKVAAMAPILPTAVAVDDTAQIEVGARTAPDTTLLVITNHDQRARKATIRLPGIGYPAGFVCDLREMQPVPDRARPSGTGVELALDLPARHSAMLGLYPERPDRLSLQPTRSSLRRGDELSYELAVSDEKGRPARGVHLVEVTVTDPGGTVRERYGGGFAVAGKLEVRVPLAINAAPGEWRLDARLPAVGRASTARVKVQ